MTINEINKTLAQNFNEIQTWVLTEGAGKWEYAPPGKWTVGQHILHLIQSTETLNNALGTPKFILNYKFGKCNRPIRNYDEVIQKYNEKLKKIPKGVVSPISINMPFVTLHEREGYLNKLSGLNLKLSKKANRIKEKSLDVSLLPHPLMGRMTLREILMWNAYHTKHHLQVLSNKY